MDCDDVMLLLAQDARTLTPDETAQLDAHLDECEACSEMVVKKTGAPRLDGFVQRLHELPTVEPTIFEGSRTLATGGMGKISRAFDRRLGREVAIKEMLSIHHRSRFEREAAITARLQHPAIVPIYEAATWPDGSVFYTMRLVSGGTLAEALQRATTLEQRLALLPHVIAVADAIAYAHSRRIVHRDLKPQNVLVGEFGETVVIDWGLAKELDGDDDPVEPAVEGGADLTKAGTILGTPCFMPPEQANGDELDERADVFAVGALLYNLIAGVPPYWDRSQDSNELVEAVRTHPPTPIAELAPRAPADLRAIVEHAMARDPADRYRNAGAMAAELRRFQAGQLLASRDYRIRDLLARWVRRHRAIVTVVGLAALVLVAVAVVAIIKITRADQKAETAFERGQRKLCEAESPRLASPWDASARTTVHHQFERLQLAYAAETLEHVDASLDHWNSDLAAVRDAACASNATRPPDQLATELDCLAERTREVSALITQFEDADRATVLGAVAAASAITPIARCTNVAVTPPLPTDSAANVAVRTQFAEIYASMQLGKFKPAFELAKTAAAAADKLGDPTIRGVAQMLLGNLQARTGNLEGGETTVRGALRLADVAHDDRTRAQAWTTLMQIGYWRGHFDQVLATETAALGSAERINDLGLQSEILMQVGGALEQLGKMKDARARFEQAVALRRKIYGDGDPRTAAALGGLGNAYAMQGDLDDGIRAHREALVTSTAALGATHPNVGIAHGNLGNDYIYALREPEAIAELEEELKIAEAANGAKHRDVAMALTDLGTAQLEGGHFATAVETFDRADATWLAVNPKHPSRAEAIVGRYLALQAQGKPVVVADLDAALALANGLPPFETARIQLALGKASTGPRAVELVKAAAAGFATSTLPLCQRNLAVAKAWLAAH